MKTRVAVKVVTLKLLMIAVEVTSDRKTETEHPSRLTGLK